ncbi:MAG: alpha/beta hydrolase [Gelidibacter sp.]|nr:alpha/beta hydrolase [Gelidibacter sp.]
MRFRHFITLVFGVFSISVFSQSTASQQVTSFSIEAPQLDTQKKIWVYLPKSYENSEKSYPVIYMHDAQNLFDVETSYVGEWKVDEYLDTISNNESIIIGIEHGNEKRIDELTPYKHEKYGGGKGDLYLDFIISTLKPKIDSTFKTLKDAKHTTIFGSSLGGLMAFYAVIEFPEIFGNAGVFSPSFWINPEIYDLVSQSTINKNTKFFFLIGTEESETAVSDQQKMVDLLYKKGVDANQIKNNIIEGGQHNEAFWSSHFADAYQWLTTNN